MTERVEDPIVAFFSGGLDSDGRTFDERLEAVHDHIQ